MASVDPPGKGGTWLRALVPTNAACTCMSEIGIWSTHRGSVPYLLQCLQFVASEGERLQPAQALETGDICEEVVGQTEVPELDQPL